MNIGVIHELSIQRLIVAWWNTIDQFLHKVGYLCGMSIKNSLHRIAVVEFVLLIFIIPAMLLPDSLRIIGLIMCNLICNSGIISTSSLVIR